jgi:hypothetical protein
VPTLGFRAKRGAANHRRDRGDAGTLLLEHFQEKWDPVFRPKCDNARMLERFLFPLYVKPL